MVCSLRISFLKGRNLSGRTGLFPQSYTTSAPPEPSHPPSTAASLPKHEDEPSAATAGRTLDSVLERDESHAASPPAIIATHEDSAAASDPSHSPVADSLASGPNYLYPDAEDNGAPSPRSEDGRRMMRATLTDVQKAIEQLGRGPDRDGARSFSFASSRDGASTDRDTSETEMESELEDNADADAGQGWHKDARQKLAEKARKAALREDREREREQAARQRMLAPPIEVELSDESEPEEGDTMQLQHLMHPSTSTSHSGRQHGVIPEESEEDRVQPTSIESAEPTATASTFPPFPAPNMLGATLYPPLDDPRAQRASALYPPRSPSPETPYEDEPTSLPTPISPHAQLPPEDPIAKVASAAPFLQPAPVSMPVPMPAPAPVPAIQARDFSSVTAGLPSPAASSFSQGRSAQPFMPLGVSTSASMADSSAGSDPIGRTHPSEWTVEEVVDWLKGKGFDQGVCDKFIGEHSKEATSGTRR